VQDTERVTRIVEKRVPVTSTCYVPRVVCYRVPLDACGNPLPASPPPAAALPGPAPEPTPAPPKGDAASKAPALKDAPGPGEPEGLPADAGRKGAGEQGKAAAAEKADKGQSKPAVPQVPLPGKGLYDGESKTK
jgi:hypothetical protein